LTVVNFCLLIALVVSLLFVTLRADETALATQKQLAQHGFFKDETNGQTGSQMSAAIRRYQIASTKT